MEAPDDTDETVWVDTVRNKVATRKGVPPEDLPPLTDAVDPRGVDDLLTSMDAVQVKFVYCDHYITVHSDRTINIQKTEYAADQNEA